VLLCPILEGILERITFIFDDRLIRAQPPTSFSLFPNMVSQPSEKLVAAITCGRYCRGVEGLETVPNHILPRYSTLIVAYFEVAFGRPNTLRKSLSQPTCHPLPYRGSGPLLDSRKGYLKWAFPLLPQSPSQLFSSCSPRSGCGR
jgi:hypothetical protein